MNENDVDREFEEQVRAEVRRSIAPPATPTYVRERVERMAEQQLEGAGRRSFRPRLGRGIIAARLAAAGVVVVLVAATVVALSHGGVAGPGSAPTDPSSKPTEVAARSGDPAGTPGGTYQPDPRDVMLAGITADGGAFVVVGGRAIRVSTDYGDTWSAARSLPVDTIWGGRAEFVDVRHGWTAAEVKGPAADTLVMYRTGDGGQTWQSATVGSLAVGPDAWAADREFHFADMDHGVLRTYGVNDPAKVPAPYSGCTQYTTEDGGVTWSSPVAVSCAQNRATWVTGTLGYSRDEEAPGNLAVTRDGGRTWTAGKLPIDASEIGWSIELLVAEPGRLRAEVGFVPKSGPDPRQRHIVYDSTDGGATWAKAYDHNADEDIRVLGASGFDHWFAQTSAHSGDAGTLIATDDGGRNWHQVASRFVSSPGPMRWWDSRSAVVQSYSAGISTVFLTSDGGRTWRQVTF